MGHRFKVLLPAFAMVLTAAVQANAQAPTLQEQLAAQYKVVKMGSDTSGYSVVDAGTLLEIKKGGILAVPYSDSSILSTKYEGGAVHSPSALMTKGLGFGMKRFGKEQTTHLFASGDKVYPSKIEVDLNKDDVALTIVACDTCNKTDPPTYNKAKVVFQFPKGSLAKASAARPRFSARPLRVQFSVCPWLSPNDRSIPQTNYCHRRARRSRQEHHRLPARAQARLRESGERGDVPRAGAAGD